MNQKTSELFMDIVTDNHGSPCIDCQFCKTCWFTNEAEGVEELRAKATKEPTKYREQNADSLAWGYIDGRQFVWGCDCDALARYEGFIWAHRHLIARYLKRRAEAELEAAKHNLNEITGLVD